MGRYPVYSQIDRRSTGFSRTPIHEVALSLGDTAVNDEPASKQNDGDLRLA